MPCRGASATAFGLAALFVVCWSSGFIGAKIGTSDASVTTVLMWRFVPLAIALAPFLFVHKGSALPLGGFGRQVAIGAVSQSGYLLTVYWAIGPGVSTGTTALIDGIQPLVVAALLGPFLGAVVTGRQWIGLALGPVVTGRQWIGLALGPVGVILVIWADATAPAASAPAWAYLVPFAGMLSLVAATFLERRTRTPLMPMRALAIHCTTSAVIFTGLAVSTGTAVPPVSGKFWIAMTWLIAYSTFGGYGLYWYLIGRIGVTQVNTLMFLVPPVTALWGALTFDEPFTTMTAAGLTLALVATWIVTRSARRRASRQQAAGLLADGH